MNRTWKVAVSMAILLVIIIGTIMFIQWGNSPSRKTVVVSTTRPEDSLPKPDQTVTTPFFTTHIPDGFRIETTQNPANTSMVHMTAFAIGGGDLQVGITSSLLTSEGLSGVADYNFRLKTPDQYEQTKSTLFPPGSVSFRKLNGPPETTVFIVHNNRYASVVVGGNVVDSTKIDTTLSILANNWKWL